MHSCVFVQGLQDILQPSVNLRKFLFKIIVHVYLYPLVLMLKSTKDFCYCVLSCGLRHA